MKSDDNISEKRNSPTVVVEYFFVDYAILRFFSISMKITTKVPICSRIGPEKVPILPESPFSPLLQHNSAQSPDGKILEGKHCIWVIFPRTGKMAKMWHVFFLTKIEALL